MKAIIKAQDMKDLIEKTKRFVCKNYNNMMMRYIHIVVDAEKMEVRAEAVDGHRFSVAYCKLADGKESFECFITQEIPKITRCDEYVEIETVDICRIEKILPDGSTCRVHEEDIKPDPDLPYGSERIAAEEILKRYCMEHEGTYRAVHEVVSRAKTVNSK